MFLFTLAACEGAKAETRAIAVDGHSVNVEIADDPVERNLGLMYRESMPADHGMLFVYPDAQPRNFWMKDTKLPLTIAYLDAAGTILTLADMRPLDTTPVPSGAPAMYALEMNKGWFAVKGVAVGDKVTGLPSPAAR
jgi:uncharacterized membrane protein (UPF0127 family)